MKTIVLFSSIFYLLGLKLGSTISFLRHLAEPVKTVITLPIEKAENKPDKGSRIYIYNEKNVHKTKIPKKDSTNVKQSGSKHGETVVSPAKSL